jgi:uncharacterized protein (TIGR02268 family)
MAKGRGLTVRSLYLRGDPEERVEPVFVAPGVVTVLRFQQPCDVAGTKLLGWEGRFEPVACAGKKVLLEPLQALAPEERFLLSVRLADGREVPFVVSGAEEEEGKRPDQQVNVFEEPEAPEALRQQLVEARAREQSLWGEVRRRFREDTVDHALARLLVSGNLKQTPFVLKRKRLVQAEGAEMEVRVYSGKAKAAVLFTVTPRDASRPWSLQEARLVAVRPGEEPEPRAFGDTRPFALRVDRDEIPAGQSGPLAVVVDRSAVMTERGPVELVLELYRQDGLRVAAVLLHERLAR